MGVTKALIVKADGFGFGSGATQGILDAINMAGRPYLPPHRVPALVGSDGSFHEEDAFLRLLEEGPYLRMS